MMTNLASTSRSRRILIVDDNPDDLRLLCDGFTERSQGVECQTAQDGLEAIEHLRTRRDANSIDLPDLILLDLNMPRMDGREFLDVVKCDPRLGRIPVVVLTSSSSETDVTRAYQAHANGYLVKPGNMSELSDLVQLIDHYWLRATLLPGV